jgi:hypothetical protein
VSDWGATIHFGIPETRMQKIGNWTKTVNSISSLDWWPNWKSQHGNGTISPNLCQLSAGRLGPVVTAGSPQPLWMDLRLLTTFILNNLANPDCEPCRYLALERGSNCHGCTGWQSMVEWWSVSNTNDNARQEWSQVLNGG